MKTLRYLAYALCALTLVACATACSTIVPQNHAAAQVEYVGNTHNGGIVAAHFNELGEQDGYIWTPSKRDDYNALIVRVGPNLFSPALSKDHGVTPITTGRYAGDYLATLEAQAKLIAMVQEDLRLGNTTTK